MTIRMSETVEAHRRYKRAQGRRQLLPRQICRERCVDCLRPQQNGNGALRLLREQRARIRLAVEQTEVLAVARAFATGPAAAYCARLKILRGAVVEERSREIDCNTPRGSENELIAPQRIFA